MKSMKKFTALMVAVLMALSILPVFAAEAETGDIRLALWDAEQNPIDSLAGLQADDIFYVPVIISNFNSNLTLTDIALTFDSSKVKLVNSSGNESTAHAVLDKKIETIKVYDEEAEEDVQVFARAYFKADNEEGFVRLANYIPPESADILGQKYFALDEGTEELVIYAARFKVVDPSGSIDIKIDRKQMFFKEIVFYADVTDLTDYSVFAFSEDEVLPKVMDFEEKAITVDAGATLEDVVSMLGDEVVAVLDDESEVTFTVTSWTSEDFDGDVAGEYTFTGEVEAVEGVDLDGKAPVAKVTVVEADDFAYAITNLDFTVSAGLGAIVKFDIELLDETYTDTGDADKVVVSIVKKVDGADAPIVVLSGKVSTTDGAQYTISEIEEGATYAVYVSVVDGFELPIGDKASTPLAAGANATFEYNAE